LCIIAGVAAATTPGASTVFKVDHQLCYTGAGKFHPPTAVPVRLIDQFSPNGFLPKIQPTLALHCNPVIKTIHTVTGAQQVFKVTNPRAHLACLPITPDKTQPTPKVVVTNQFGKATLYLQQPNLLCLPSWKSLTGPPNLKPTTPPGLNHFTCYPVTDFTGGVYKIPPVVLLRDEFAKTPVKVAVNPIPRELCLPTKKIVGKTVYPIIDPAMHLLCFNVSKTPIKPRVWDENQFGTSVVNIRATKWLCLPSTKQVVSSG
jgi:hypothetical protein